MGPWRSPVAHLHGMQGVRGSNPLGSTIEEEPDTVCQALLRFSIGSWEPAHPPGECRRGICSGEWIVVVDPQGQLRSERRLGLEVPQAGAKFVLQQLGCKGQDLVGGDILVIKFD